MIESLDELTDINLKLIIESNKPIFFRLNFIDKLGSELNSTDSLRIAVYMESAKLIKLEEKKRYRCDLTAFGNEVYNTGGWLEHQNNKKSNKNQEDLIKSLTIKQLNGSIFQLKYWWLILLLSGIIGFVSGNFKLIIDLFN